MQKEALRGKNVWDGAQLAASRDWIFDIPSDTTHLLLETARWLKAEYGAFDTVDLTDCPIAELENLAGQISTEVERGKGVCLVRGLPISPADDALNEMMFWVFALHLGYPEIQDHQGQRLHHVRAERTFTSKDEAERAFLSSNLRGYQTNLELKFHNDGSDILLFLCKNQSRSGGTTRVISAATAFNEVLRRSPRAAETLQRAYPFDTRGESDQPVQYVPVFSFVGDEISVLYKRGYIDLAAARPDTADLTDDQREALDLLDDVLADERLYHEFRLEPGDLLIANNYSVLHARGDFPPHETNEPPRHMLRIWATLRHHRRQLPEALKHTREFSAAQRRREALAANSTHS